MSGHRGRCAIAGIGHTAFSKDPGVSSLTLALPVCRDAIAHAGGVRFVTDLPGRQELAVGRPMVVRFDEVGDGITRPRWQPA